MLYWTAIIIALKKKCHDIIKLLIDKVSDIKRTNIHGKTLLHLCCEYDVEEFIWYLIEIGSELNVQDSKIYYICI